MSKQMLISLGLLLVVFVSGIALGLYMGGGSQVSDAPEKRAASSLSGIFSSSDAQNRVEANTLLSNRILELEKELAEQKNEQHAALANRMAFFKKYQKEIRLSAFDTNLKVTPEMAELLGLSKEEQQEIEQQLAETKSEMDKIEDADTVLAKQTANGVTYDIPADPKGKAIKDNLTSELTSEIGADQAQLFMAYVPDSDYSDSSLSGFAEQNKEIQIAWTKQNGNPQYTVKTSFSGNGNTGWSSFSTSSLPPEDQKYLPVDSASGP